MKAYSLDLRERVLRAVDEGKPRTQIIELFHVSRATIKRYLKLRRETGQVQPHVIPGRTPKKGGRCERSLKKPSRSSKRISRRVGARTREALEEAICQALLTTMAADAHGWFRHCGYVPVGESSDG